MKKLSISIITKENFHPACDYIQKQFDTRSWWPRAQPGLAKQEFQLMNDYPEALNIWCHRWLDTGQICKLLNRCRY